MQPLGLNRNLKLAGSRLEMESYEKIIHGLKCSNCSSFHETMKIFLCGHIACLNCLPKEEKLKRQVNQIFHYTCCIIRRSV